MNMVKDFKKPYSQDTLKAISKDLITEVYNSSITDKEIEIQENKKEQERRQRQIAVNDSKIGDIFGKRFENCTFENYKADTPKKRQILKACIDYVCLDKSKGECLILYGTPGTGKDHLLAAMCRMMPLDFVYEDLEYIAEVKRVSQVNGEIWQKAIKKYCHISMLVIPDFCTKEKFSDSQKEVFIHIINERYKNLLPMIIATNLTPKSMRQVIDFEGLPRVADRFSEMFADRQYILDWESYRKGF